MPKNFYSAFYPILEITVLKYAVYYNRKSLTPGLRDKRIGSTAPGGILLKHHGLKGAQAVVILAMTANGKLLPPFLVLKVHQF